MSFAGFKASNHPQQVQVHGSDDKVDDRETPPALFAQLNERFNFTLDAAAASHNAKCSRYFDRVIDGLTQPWAGETVWCNPPYSNVPLWVGKAWRESGSATVVMLLPANRTEQPWWQEMVEPFRDQPGSPLRTEFIAGRLKFTKPGQSILEKANRPPFGCVVLIWQTVGFRADVFTGGLFGDDL
jgi:phage N-6-adenine-methyltransferase